MGYTTVFTGKQKANMVRKFVVDTYNDISSINISQLLPGSTAFVINTSQTYMLNNARQWTLINVGGGSGGGSSSGGNGDGCCCDCGGNIIYDGGDLDNPAGDFNGNLGYDGGDMDG